MNRKLFTAALALPAALVAALIVTSTSADAKLKCKNVGKRMQICGDAKPFKSFTVGVGIRFSKKQPGYQSN